MTIETVLIADTLALGRALAKELGLDPATTKVVSKPDQLRGWSLAASVRVIAVPQFMPVQTMRDIEENLRLCGVAACEAVPGTATLQRNEDGSRTVLHADPTIAVAVELLNGDLEPDAVEEDGTLRLDTAGQYRYRFVRAQDEHTHIYERITT